MKQYSTKTVERLMARAERLGFILKFTDGQFTLYQPNPHVQTAVEVESVLKCYGRHARKRDAEISKAIERAERRGVFKEIDRHSAKGRS